MGNIILLGGIYIIGYFFSLLFLKKYAKKMGFGDYDEPKTYTNCDDWNSNASAWTAFSIIWPIFYSIGFIVFACKSLVKLTKIITKNEKI